MAVSCVFSSCPLWSWTRQVFVYFLFPSPSLSIRLPLHPAPRFFSVPLLFVFPLFEFAVFHLNFVLLSFILRAPFSFVLRNVHFPMAFVWVCFHSTAGAYFCYYRILVSQISSHFRTGTWFFFRETLKSREMSPIHHCLFFPSSSYSVVRLSLCILSAANIFSCSHVL